MKMQILIRDGKGGKDRFVILSNTNLDILRDYWKYYRPKEWLFYSRNNTGSHIDICQDCGNYKDNSKCKVMTLSAFEFIRRFLIHILPPRFMKIRHYGLLGNRNKNTNLKLCKILTNTPILLKQKASTLQLIQKLTGKDISICPCCGSNKLKSYTNFTNTS